MEILRWQAGNSLKNYQYILNDAEKNAVLIDPLDFSETLKMVNRFALKVRAVCITHEHDDHAGAAHAIQQELGVSVYTTEETAKRIRVSATTLDDGAKIHASRDLVLQLRSTPGHAAGHAAFECNGFFFSGDCLFHGGCGHCRLPGADLGEHYRTLSERIGRLSPNLILMPGHYYAARNLDFSLHVEPQNTRARALRERITCDADEMAHQTTIKQEGDYNPFLRLSNRALRLRLAELTGRNLSEASDEKIFTELRALRDIW